MRIINIRTIPHEQQRYETVGDYWRDKDGIDQIRVSYLKDWKMGILIAIHELWEYALCLDRGIKESDITTFDMGYTGEGEPGDSEHAPYHQEHRSAGNIEKILAMELGVDWKEYDKSINELFKEKGA